MSTTQSNGGSGCCLGRLILIGALVWGAHWLWEHKHDELLELKNRAQEKAAAIVTSDGDRTDDSADAMMETGFQAGGAETRETGANQRSDVSPATASAWRHADNWTRAKAEHVADLTDADIRIIENWNSQKPIVVRRVGEIKEKLGKIIAFSPAYSYDKSSLAKLQSTIATVERCIAIGDPLRLEETVPAMTANAKAFFSSVKWRAGVPHPRAPHVHSGRAVESWEPDSGYIYASNRDDDLTVFYRGHPYRCPRCQGHGIFVQVLRCPTCQGQGRVPNPVIQGGRIVCTVLEMYNGFSRHPHYVSLPQLTDPGMVCGTCHGHGSIKQQIICTDCEKGTVWR